MAGERQTEPHQAGVGPSPREALEALERADLRDRAEAAEDELARLRAARDEAVARAERAEALFERLANAVEPYVPERACKSTTVTAYFRWKALSEALAAVREYTDNDRSA